VGEERAGKVEAEGEGVRLGGAGELDDDASDAPTTDAELSHTVNCGIDDVRASATCI